MKKILIILSLILFSTTYAQESLGFGVYQDGKLLVLGDKEHGISPGTLDILLRLKMQGNQGKIGYLSIYPEFEYADLDDPYIRYSANVGYTFNQLFLKKLELHGSGGFGITNRFGGSTSSLSMNFETAYYILENLKIAVNVQLVQRKDLDTYYGTSGTIKASVFYGLEYRLKLKRNPR